MSSKPSGKGGRIIISHVGSNDGFLEGCGDIFIGNMNSEDYHQEMNSEHFEYWFRKFIQLVPNNSAIVLDRAKYHRRITEETKNPTTCWVKPKIIEWLSSRNIPVPRPFPNYASMTKPLLLEWTKKHKIEPKFVLNEIIDDSGKDVTILWLPVAHCELNAIELIWAYVKRIVAKENTTFNIHGVLELVKTTMSNLPEDLWESCMDHVMVLEEKIRSAENVSEKSINEIQRIIIPLGESDSDDTDFEEDEDTIVHQVSTLAIENENEESDTESRMDIDIACNCKSQLNCCKTMRCVCKQYKVKCGINCHKHISQCNNK